MSPLKSSLMLEKIHKIWALVNLLLLLKLTAKGWLNKFKHKKGKRKKRQGMIIIKKVILSIKKLSIKMSQRNNKKKGKLNPVLDRECQTSPCSRINQRITKICLMIIAKNSKLNLWKRIKMMKRLKRVRSRIKKIRKSHLTKELC